MRNRVVGKRHTARTSRAKLLHMLDEAASSVLPSRFPNPEKPQQSITGRLRLVSEVRILRG